ncbi:MAG: hypothetical protein ACK4VY_09830 [Brevundimonas sp.]
MANTNTGTADATIDPISVAYHALQGAENCAEQDAQGDDAAAFFRDAQQKQRDIAERAKSLLSRKLA